MSTFSKNFRYLIVILLSIVISLSIAIPLQASINYTSKVATPTFTPQSGTYTSPQNFSISCATNGATIYFTTNGATPNSSSPIYTHSFTLTGNATIKAKAFKTGMSESDVASATYCILVSSTVKVAKPVFTPQSGTYTGAQTVIISCATKDATIMYSFGVLTTTVSTIYSGPLQVSTNTTIIAKAFKTGMVDSEIATASYTIVTANGKVETPVFNPPAGTYYGTQNVTITCPTSGATIRITSGSNLTAASTAYNGKYLTISGNVTLTAKAYKTGMDESDAASAKYTIITSNSNAKVATPVFSPSGGIYTSPQNVTISCATSGATIRITSNGIPTSSSSAYTNPLTITGNVTITAKAFKSGMAESEAASATFTIITQTNKVATPTFSLASGTYSGAQTVTISCSTSGATITFTTNGETPNALSTVYNGQITLTGNATIKAKAYKTGMSDSEVATATYTIINEKVATPTFSLASGNYSAPQTVTISCATSDATIYYTTNGTSVTSASTLYAGPITVTSNTTIVAKAFKNGMAESSVNYVVIKII